MLREQRGQLAATTTTDAPEPATTNHSPKAAVDALGGDYAIDKQEELQQLDQCQNNSTITSRPRFTARSEVEQWRWAEIRRGQIKDARRQALFLARQPEQSANLTQ